MTEKGCYVKKLDPTRFDSYGLPLVAGFRREKANCRNENDISKWVNEKFVGLVNDIGECADRCIKTNGCNMMNYYY